MWRFILGGAITCALFGLLAVAAPGCGDSEGSTFCTFNSDCPETETPYCVNGLCRAEQCIEDRDCGDGESCVESACVADDES